MSEESFRVTPRSGASEAVQILGLGGAITFSKSAMFQDAVAKLTAPRLILDLTDVPSLDSMAVGAPVRAYVPCNKAGRKLDPLFETYATVADAERSLR